MRCSNCRAKVSPEAVFCGRCGTRMQPESETVSPDAKPKAPSTYKRLVLLGLPIVLAASLGIGGFMIWRSARQDERIPAGQERGLSQVPDARHANLAPLLRDEAKKKKVLYAELDGPPPEEIILWSTAELPGIQLAQQYVDVFSWQSGAWTRIFDGLDFDPPRDYPPVLTSNPPVGGDQVAFLGVIDPQGDKKSEVVLAVQQIGAGTGPLRLWILGPGDDSLHVLFYTETVRGGGVSLSSDQIVLESGEYAETDPLCCPTWNSIDTIGLNDVGLFGILSSSIEPNPAQSPEAAAQVFYRAWASKDRRAAEVVAKKSVVRRIFVFPPDDESYFTDDKFIGCEQQGQSTYGCTFFHDGIIDLFVWVGQEGDNYIVTDFYFAGSD